MCVCVCVCEGGKTHRQPFFLRCKRPLALGYLMSHVQGRHCHCPGPVYMQIASTAPPTLHRPTQMGARQKLSIHNMAFSYACRGYRIGSGGTRCMPSSTINQDADDLVAKVIDCTHTHAHMSVQICVKFICHNPGTTLSAKKGCSTAQLRLQPPIFVV